MYDIAIIGCGVIGAAAAYALSRYDNKVVILEAENDVADCTTKANSAILHAGYDPALISLAGKKYKISIGIEDPMTGKLAVRFSMKGTYNEGKNYLFQ